MKLCNRAHDLAQNFCLAAHPPCIKRQPKADTSGSDLAGKLCDADERRAKLFFGPEDERDLF